MDNKAKFVLLKNAAANVVRGGAASAVAIILPPFLARLMSADAYGAWSLVLQLSAYTAYLDFGIQTAVGRFIAHANELRDARQRDSVVSTAFAALTVTGVAAIAGTVGMTILLPSIFRHMPSALVGETRLALLLVACSLALGLPASVFNGIFVGLQRYEVPAAIIGVSRILSALLVILVVRRGANLPAMALAVTCVNLTAYGFQYLMYRRIAPEIQFSVSLISIRAGRELLKYCLSLTVWSFAMLLITGLDVFLVGYFKFEELAYYAIAATAVTFLTGLQNAVFGVMIPSTAVQHARGDAKELGRVMVTATRYGSFLLLLTGLPLILGAKSILSLWVGRSYANHTTLVLQVLTAGNVLRLSATPYAMTLIGTGQQRLAIATTLAEGSSNLIASIIAGSVFGALGVAIGTAFGSLVGIVGNFTYNMRRTKGIDFEISSYVRDGLLRPLVCALPLVFLAIVFRWNYPRLWSMMALSTIVMVATAFLVWHFGLVDGERERLRGRSFAPQT
jgi:O-antigen/teichoic acid export membrane protein